MFKITLGSALDPKEVIVNPKDSLKSVLVANRVSADGVISHNSRNLSVADLDRTLESLCINAGDNVFVTRKMRSA